MIRNKKIAALTAAGLIVGFLGVGHALAQTSTTSPTQTLAEKLAAKFNLNKDDVNTFLTQTQEERRQEMQTKRQEEMSTKLDQAVKDGVITADQKQKILDKQAEMQKQREQHRTEMEKWASDNGIDFSKLSGYGIGGFGGRGFGGGHGHGMMRDF